MSAAVLIVDDEQSLARQVARILQRKGYVVDITHNAKQARQRMGEFYPEVVLMDLHLPDADGGELMQELKQDYPDCRFIIITGHGTISSAVKLTQGGAADYLTKPFESEELILSIKNALINQARGDEIKRLRAKQAGPRPSVVDFEHASARDIYLSPAAKQLRNLTRRAVEQDGIVLLLGESGTGKDYLARQIHRESRRADGPFFDINCGALPRELAESELFGHEPGAFTGTRGRKRGLLELAEDGSLLLNEIGELDLKLQSKLLTFLDTRSFLRVGGEKSITVNARIFAATNRDLENEVEQKRFRKDLYYRLNVFPVHLPPLRERKEDIPALVEELYRDLTADMGLGPAPAVTPAMLDKLVAYSWPGNIRELRNVLERSLMLSGQSSVDAGHLDLGNDTKKAKPDEWQIVIPFEPGKNLHEITAHVARRLVEEALFRAKNKQQAAELLGISRHALAHQIKSLGIDE